MLFDKVLMAFGALRVLLFAVVALGVNIFDLSVQLLVDGGTS